MALSTAILVLLLLCCTAFMYEEGFWSNFITLVCVFLSMIVAFNTFEPLAEVCTKSLYKTANYYWDILCLWFVFGLTLLMLKMTTTAISRYRVRFVTAIEYVGTFGCCILIALSTFCFTSFSVHVGPLPVETPTYGAPEAASYLILTYVSLGSMVSLSADWDDQGDDTERLEHLLNLFPRYRSHREKFATSTEFWGP